MKNYKVSTIDWMYTKKITLGINQFKYQSSNAKTIICRLNDTFNIGNAKKAYVIAYERKLNEYYIILNCYWLV